MEGRCMLMKDEMMLNDKRCGNFMKNELACYLQPFNNQFKANQKKSKKKN
jgi:hypothetical protein